jgi:hypothetical protein
MWSMRPSFNAGSPVIPAASTACRIFQVNVVSGSVYFASNRWWCSLTRKNQFPPQATSPVIGP